LPKLDTTPPVTKTYFADIDATSSLSFWDWPYLVGTFKYGRDLGCGERGNYGGVDDKWTMSRLTRLDAMGCEGILGRFGTGVSGLARTGLGCSRGIGCDDEQD